MTNASETENSTGERSLTSFLMSEVGRLRSSLGRDLTTLGELAEDKTWHGVSFFGGEIIEKAVRLKELSAKLQLLDDASKAGEGD